MGIITNSKDVLTVEPETPLTLCSDRDYHGNRRAVNFTPTDAADFPRRTAPPPPPDDGTTPQSRSAASVKDEALAAHNDLRALHGASALRWNVVLAYDAEILANGCSSLRSGEPYTEVWRPKNTSLLLVEDASISIYRELGSRNRRLHRGRCGGRVESRSEEL